MLFWLITIQDRKLKEFRVRKILKTMGYVFLATERHPFYVNKLCDRLWSLNKKIPPSLSEISKAWLEVIEEEKSDAIKDILQLSIGQKAVLIHIANGTAQLTSKKTILSLGMTSSSIIAAIEGLEEKDVIEKLDDKYHVINPILKHFVLKSSTEAI